MDDSLADDTAQFVDQSTRSRLGRLGANTNLGMEGLTMDTNLNREATGVDRDLRLGQGDEFRGEQRRQEGVQNQTDAAQLGASTQNANNTQDRSADYWARRAQLPGMRRNMALDDFGLDLSMDDRDNAADSDQMDALFRQFQAGMGYNQADQQRRDSAGNLIGQVGQDAFGRGQSYTNNAQQYGQAAGGAASQNYTRENAGANWLGRALGGLGMGAAQSAIGGLTGGMGGGGGFMSRLGGLFGGGGGSGRAPGGATTNLGGLFNFARRN
jgi:hypothetical protein